MKLQVGDFVGINLEYFKKKIFATPQTSEMIGDLLWEISKIMDLGSLAQPKLTFARLCPVSKSHRAYNSGQGVVLYFSDSLDLESALVWKDPATQILIRSPNLKNRAIFTLVSNGNRFIKLWHKYYSQFFSDLYVLDINSTDDSLSGLNCQILRHDVDLGLGAGNHLINQFKNQILRDYQYVVYTDYDEILWHPQGLDVLIQNLSQEYITATGYEIVQKRGQETALDFSQSILSQRSYWTRNWCYDKTLITSTDLHWDAGFHTVRGKSPNYQTDLLLLHLNKIDFGFLQSLHQKLYNEKSPLGGAAGTHHLLGKELEEWWRQAETQTTPIPDHLRKLNFI